MSGNIFNSIRHIDRYGIETWNYSDLADRLSEVPNLTEWMAAAQIAAIDDGIDLKLHIWFESGDDYILDRTMCGYLLAACPDWYESVRIGRAYFECSQIRKARAIVWQLEINNSARAT